MKKTVDLYNKLQYFHFSVNFAITLMIQLYLLFKLLAIVALSFLLTQYTINIFKLQIKMWPFFVPLDRKKEKEV